MLKKRRLSSSRDWDMTLPDERYRAVQQARRLLEELCDPKMTPRIPAGIRDRARGALRHYPHTYDMQRTAEAVPEIFQEHMEDLHRFIRRGQQLRGDQLFDPEVSQPLPRED